MTSVLTGATCPYLTCLVEEPHTHPSCPDCGAVRYGNSSCPTCVRVRACDLNPHDLVREGAAAP